MARVRSRAVFALCLLSLLVALPARGQLATQEIALSPGWNAVFLEVTPEVRSCDAIFRGLPIASVWRWNPKASTHQYVHDPATLSPESPDWLVYFPPPLEENTLSTLHALHGGRSYLVNLNGVLPVTLRLKGEPAVQALRWQADSFNFVGFSVSATAPPTFQNFFASSPAHAGKPMYTLDAEGRWQEITNPATTHLVPFRAYWIYCQGTSTYQGPTRVVLEHGRDLNFSDVLVESRVFLSNETTASRTFTLQVSDSRDPETVAFPERAGGVALSYYKTDYTGNDAGWRDFDAPVTVTVPAKTQTGVRLAVRRADLTPYTPSSPDADYTYQSLLVIEDGMGSRITAPVRARSLQSTADKSGGVHPRAGLWIGTVALGQVSEHVPRRVSDGPQPTASDFQFKIILHVDAQGAPRLLRQVTQMWRPGTYTTAPDNPEMQVVDRPGEYVLFTDLAKIDAYVNQGKIRGAALRDGTPAGRRVSTSIFGFNDPLLMTGSLPTPQQPTATLAATVTLDYDDPLNPFLHRYHPDHNNLKPDYSTMLDEGIESWTVVRHLTLDFTATDPEFPEGAQAGWGDTRIGGVYIEVLEGLHRQDITVQGTFRLSRVSNVAVLDPEL